MAEKNPRSTEGRQAKDEQEQQGGPVGAAGGQQQGGGTQGGGQGGGQGGARGGGGDDGGADEVKQRIDQENEQGFAGIAVDETPRDNYTLKGVGSGASTPETERGERAAERAGRDR